MYSDATPVTRSSGTGSKLFAADEPALSANEPMYFVVGGGGGATARFQLSFKYRLFDPDSHPVQWIPFLSRLHFGYTQTSIWDLGANSSPFRDTSYRPSLFWQGETHGESRLMPEVLRAGFRATWAAKDYQTIIGIANKLPEETLQEDEKLLTLYDLALTRTEDGL